MSFEHWLVAGQSRPESPNGIRYRRHRLAAYLAERPDTSAVYWVHFRRRQRDGVRVERIGPNVWAVTVRDALDFFRYRAGGVHKVIREQMDRSGDERVLWYTHPSFPALASCPGWDAIVYDASDVWVASRGDSASVAATVRRASAGLAECRIASAATHIFATSPYIAERLEARCGRPATSIVENGVDVGAFAIAGEAVRPPQRPQLVYAGAIKPNLDLRLLARVSQDMPEAEIVCAGPISGPVRTAARKLFERSNVTYLGAVSEADVPRVLAAAAVGLLPYSEIAWNKGVSPLKFFEYLAAGLPVVGLGLPSLAKYHKAGVYFHADNDESFVRECIRAANARAHADVVAKRVAIATDHDWSVKFGGMMDLVLGRSTDRGSPYADLDVR
jgi:teichuronic acid biosynthesis glycosyltransferase TuaH